MELPTHGWGAQLQSFGCISSKLYWLRDWIYAARSCLSKCTLEFPSVHADSLYPLVFPEVKSLSIYACSEKNLQDANPNYTGHGHTVRTHLQQIKARTSELIEFGDSCFIFVVVVRFADNDHDRQTSRSVLLHTFFSACREVIFDLRKNRRGYKNHLRWTDG